MPIEGFVIKHWIYGSNRCSPLLLGLPGRGLDDQKFGECGVAALAM
jgi:hypothetical protein